MNTRCLACMEEHNTQGSASPHCGAPAKQSAQDSLTLKPGTLLQERYIVGKSLGSGGFGVTYIGWDTTLQKKIAIKEFLPSGLATRAPGQTCISVLGGQREEEFKRGLQSFHEEAMRLARFSEPGIVDVFDCIYANNTAYIIMEFLDGNTVVELLHAEGPMTLPQVLNILEPLLKSLEAVHTEGMLHRDIAPDNIFVTKNGEVKLIDFGAARYASSNYSKSMTVLFKDGYAPEEQYHKRGNQGPWSDVYALAATAYKMLTGVAPPRSIERIDRDSLQKPSKLGASLPGYAENAIMNALNVFAEHRTKTAMAFLNELTNGSAVRVTEKRKKKTTQLPSWMKLSGIIAACIVAALAVILALSRNVGGTPIFSNTPNAPNGKVRVPDIVCKTMEEAWQLAEEAQLQLMVMDNIEDESIPKNMILTQTPLALQWASPGDVIQIVLSAGELEKYIPDMSQYEKPAAVARLEEMGFDVKVRWEIGLLPEGAVLRTEPPSGTLVPIGTEIVLVACLGPQEELDPSELISPPDGPKTVYVPEVAYRTKQKASERLSEAGLKASFEYKENASVAKDTVFEQNPAPGTGMAEGDEVKLTVSLGGPATTKQTTSTAITSSSTTQKATTQYNYQSSSTTIARTSTTTTKAITTTAAPKKYTVSFNANGGSNPPARIAVEVSDGGSAQVNLPSEKDITAKSYRVSFNSNRGSGVENQKLNCEFNGWRLNSATGTRYSPGSTYRMTENTVFYADWTNPTLKELPVPTRSGYDFEGWYTSSTGEYGGWYISSSWGTKITLGAAVTHDVTYYARWTQNNANTISAVTSSTVIDNSNQTRKVSFDGPSSYTLKVGETQRLTWTVAAGTGYSKDNIKSSNNEVAEVDWNGLVTAKSAGTCTITINTYNYVGDYIGSASVTITVTN